MKENRNAHLAVLLSHPFFYPAHRLQIDEIITIIKHSHSSCTFWTNEDYFQAFKFRSHSQLGLQSYISHWQGCQGIGTFGLMASSQPELGGTLSQVSFYIVSLGCGQRHIYVITTSTTASTVSVSQLVGNDASLARAVTSNPRIHTSLNALSECEVVIFKHLVIRFQNDARPRI